MAASGSPGRSGSGPPRAASRSAGEPVRIAGRSALLLEVVEHEIDHTVAQPPHLLELEPQRVGRVGQGLRSVRPVSRHRT